MCPTLAHCRTRAPPGAPEVVDCPPGLGLRQDPVPTRFTSPGHASRRSQAGLCRNSPRSIKTTSSTVQEIEQAIPSLGPQDLATLRDWFAAYDAELWERQLEQDVAAGRLDWLAEESRRDPNAGRCTDL
jgi:hypothetical protein